MVNLEILGHILTKIDSQEWTRTYKYRQGHTGAGRQKQVGTDRDRHGQIGSRPDRQGQTGTDKDR